MKLAKKFDENVFYYEKVFKNPQKIIKTLNYLNDYPETYVAITKWNNWLASNDLETSFGEKKDMFYQLKDQVYGKKSKKVKFIIETMRSGIIDICHQYVKDKNLDIVPNVSPFLDMCKYTKGGNLGLHYDGQDGDKSLLYSIVMYFNNNYEGGELSFHIESENRKRPSTNNVKDPDIDFWLKPAPGSAIVFPSTKPYLHQSHPIISGNKYMSTAFILVDGYNPYNPEHVRKYRK
jgi:hypothetical protein